MSSALINIALICELTLAICAMINYKLFKGNILQFFPILYLYITSTELYAHFFQQNNNVLWYNILALVQYVLLFALYYKQAERVWERRIHFVSLMIYLSVFIWDYTQAPIHLVPYVNNFIVGAFLVLISIVLYFVDVLNAKYVYLVENDIVFWISVSNLLFFVGYLPIRLTSILLSENNNSFEMLFITQLMLVIITNSIAIFGILWIRRKLQP